MKEGLDRLEKDLSAMMGRMKAGNAGNFQKKWDIKQLNNSI